MQQQIEKFRLAKTVIIKMNEHANLDSFPLRYGFTFDKDTELEIHCDPSTLRPDKNPKYKDRYNIVAKFVNPSNNMPETGVFYLINNQDNKYFDNDKVITIIRHLDEKETEHHLSEVIRSLRLSNDLSCQDLIKMHPLYMTRQLSTHGQLVKLLVHTKSAEEVLRIKSISDQAVEKFEKLNHEIDGLNDAIQELKDENIEIQNELNEYKVQENMANTEGSTQTLEEAKILVDVNSNVTRGKSSCTELVMGDGTKLYMKTSTFDKNLKVTAKARLLKGRKVRTSCWDPIKQPGRFSSQGYFRNLYALSDKDVY
ncbi:hypothetical protein OAD78_02265 [Candidatus Thioglobus sp.]|nr:hypothetical protein [Candidatus Thioglobus sp.]